MFSIKKIFIGVISLLFLSTNAFANINEVKITASDAMSEDLFGESVSISGDYAVVGAYKENNAAGAAYIFKRNGGTWIEETKIRASDPVSGDWFGRSVSIDGDYIVVGAYIKNSSRGAAYVFKRDGLNWTQQAKLTHSDSADGDFFGFSVSINGDYIAASAHGRDDSGDNSGVAYIFKRNGDTWTQQAKLEPADLSAGNGFSRNISISGDYVIAGAYLQSNRSGSAYIFKRDGDTWAQQTKITASDKASYDYFGKWVSISGDYAAVSAEQNGDNGSWSGSAYIFKRNGTDWTEQTKLLPSDGATSDFFSYRLAIKGNHLVVGAYGDNGESDLYPDSGSVYIFERDGLAWTQVHKITASDPAADNQFSRSVSIDGNYIIVGSHQYDGAGTPNSGAAYIYKFQETNPTITIVPDNTTPVIGDTICFDVNIADSNGLYSSAFDMTYDPNALQYQSASEGNFLNSDSGATFFEASLLNDDPASGIVVVGVSRVADIGEIAGSGTIATVCFSVVGGSGADTNVGIDNGYFEGENPGTPITVIEGEDPVIPVEIGVPANLLVADPGTLDRLDLTWDVAPDASGYEIYRATTSGGAFSLIGTTASNAYQDSDCILTSVTYYYKIKAISAAGTSTGAFSSEASGFVAGLAGDINKDNRVDGRDLTILARAFHTNLGDADYNCLADLDRSENIDGDDLVVLTTSFGDQV